ncbi:PfkB family carbohydrate kinase [Capnocytophaga sp. G2]|uniref:PfkB family carbohydrate kinase n=1 Tax=Capnocytophaga sp. G2 TaxID=3110695 RepID=UPI002B45A5E2|nr:PfkB family carbohydrate kinase [Capnocytophaga sp. G2]MEB3004352.1 PfkB family carbohydrate kinase [Capnocytophaga sp. G2]
MNNKVLTVGTLAFDTIETPFTKAERIMGGAANYSALATAVFDVEQAVVSVVGEDYPSSFLEVLTEREVDISQVEIVKGAQTFFWSGRYATNMNERVTLETQENALRNYIPKLSSDFAGASFILLGNLHPKVQLQVLEQLCERPQLIVLDTMNYWIENTPELLDEAIRKIDILTVSDEEACALTGETNFLKAVEKLQAKGVNYIIIKKGEHGSMLFHEDKSFFTPALPLAEVCDPTGAGDTFAGGFIGYMAKTGDISFENMKNALAYASTLASFCVEKIGTERLLTLTKEEVLRRLFYLKELTQFDINIV